MSEQVVGAVAEGGVSDHDAGSNSVTDVGSLESRNVGNAPGTDLEVRPKVNWWSPPSLRLHLALLVCFPGFMALGYWQLTRALSGNTLSWAYTFEWPIFAGYAVYLWWNLLHEWPGSERAGRTATPNGAPAASSEAQDRVVNHSGSGLVAGESHDRGAGGNWDPAVADPEESDPELDDYNRYLAALRDSGHRKSWGRSGRDG